MDPNMSVSIAAPITAQPPQPERERLIHTSVELLQRLAEESDKLLEHLQSTFSSVLFHEQPSTKAPDEPAYPGSDLGQTLHAVSQVLDRNFRSIRELAEASDL